MSDGTFKPVSNSSEKRLYGPRKLLLCGFSSESQDKMGVFLEMIGMADIDRVWALPGDGEKTVGELMGLSNDTGRGIDSGLPRAVIMAGITEKELHLLVDSCRRAGMRQTLFATLTPVSEKWSLGDLLRELGCEREALADPS
ncbi:MAG: DUF3783 domain-containing protein [Desulfobacterales bacterium]|nr:DUF3783 domain-containing protein [Desulfobacterales bacterium]